MSKFLATVEHIPSLNGEVCLSASKMQAKLSGYSFSGWKTKLGIVTDIYPGWGCSEVRR